jgi:thiamine-phosphate pyrophosphorylase
LREERDEKVKEVFSDKRLYCILGEEFSKGRSNVYMAEQMVKSGVGVIQYREKEKTKLKKLEECIKIRSLTKEAGVLFIVNDDIDIALLTQADGVHVGQDDLPAKEVRKIIGDKMILGVSTHSPEQALAAVLNGADYIGVGPIFKTFTKKDVCAPVGLGYLEYAVKNIHIPHVAIGGIKESNLDSVLSAGARCVCMVTEILGADDVVSTIRRISDKINKGVVR